MADNNDGSDPPPADSGREPRPLPSGIAPSFDGAETRTVRERLNAQLAQLADEAESRAWQEFEAAVLDAIAPGPGPIDVARAVAAREAQALAPHFWVSLPIQGPASGQVAFLLGHSIDDDHGGLVGLPLAEAYIDLSTMSAAIDRLAGGGGEPAFPLPARAARALPAGQATALWSELTALADELAVTPAPTASQLDRFDSLLRCLVPPELFPHYLRLNPPFFERLATASGRGPLAPATEPPPLNPDYLPADPSLFDLLENESLWDLDCAALAEAARGAGLDILEGSVLPSSWGTISETIEVATGRSPAEWVDELAALAEPGWQIRIRGASLNGRMAATYSIARKPPHAWVCTNESAPGCSITVGAGPASAYRLAVSSLLELGGAGVPDQFVEIAAGDAARLLAQAAESSALIAEAVTAFPLAEATPAPADALDPLRLAAPVAAAAAFPDAVAAVAIMSTGYSDGRRTSTGLLAVATPGGAWIAAPATPWTGEMAADAPVFLYSVDPNLLRLTVAKAVGLPEPPEVGKP